MVRPGGGGDDRRLCRQLGRGRAVRSPWPFLAVGVVYCFGIGIAIGVVRQCQGVVGRWDRRKVIAAVLGSALCLMVGLGAYAGAWAVGFWARGTVAGVCAGATFWGAAAVINRQIRRSVDAATPDGRR